MAKQEMFDKFVECFSKGKVEEACPGIPVEAIDMKLYGRMDGKGVLAAAKKLIGA